MAELPLKGDRRQHVQFKPHGPDSYLFWDKTSIENIPSDVNAFFGHPLTAATNAIDGDSLALLHEYQNLPPIDGSKEPYHFIEVGGNSKITEVNELLVMDTPTVERRPSEGMSTAEAENIQTGREEMENAKNAEERPMPRLELIPDAADFVPMSSPAGSAVALNHTDDYDAGIHIENGEENTSPNIKSKKHKHPEKVRRAGRRRHKPRHKHATHESEAMDPHQQTLQHHALNFNQFQHQLQMKQPEQPQLLHQFQQPVFQPAMQQNASPVCQSVRMPVEMNGTLQAHAQTHQTAPDFQQQYARAGQNHVGYITYTPMDALNNNVANVQSQPRTQSTSKVAQSHSVLQAALTKPLPMHGNQLQGNEFVPTTSQENRTLPPTSAGLPQLNIQRTVNTNSTWTPSTNIDSPFSQCITVQTPISPHVPTSQSLFTPHAAELVHLSNARFSTSSENFVGDHHEALSVDSGILSDTCVSPSEPLPAMRPRDEGLLGLDRVLPSPNDIAKRRSSTGSTTPSIVPVVKPESQVPKRKNDPTGMRYYLEAPTSSFQRIDEDRVTYINKGQYYGLTLQCNFSLRKDPKPLRNETVKSVVLVALRCDKKMDERGAWDLWYGRQHNVKQRVIDIDTKNSTGVILESIQEISNNAFCFNWRPRERHARVNIALHCLSTDFSNQKGVKGVPLHVQIDTFEDPSDRFPFHRAYCQIKAFCDKGAERKIRDEDRRKEAKQKVVDSRPTNRRRPVQQTQTACNRSEFYSMSDLEMTPFLFFGYQAPNQQQLQQNRSYPVTSYSNSSQCNQCSCGCHDSQTPPLYSPSKKARVDDHEKVLLYARRPDETAFTALVLRLPTSECLKKAIEEKFQVPSHEVRNIFKHSMKGMIVKMDDDIIQNYTNESTFEIEVLCRDNSGCDIQLREIEPHYARFR